MTPSFTNSTLHRFHPLHDPRWSEFLSRHPLSTIFHTAQWLETLRRTYSYEPVAFTTSPPNEPLQNAAVFCCVDSWLTGRRLVGLPFSDHCDVLTDETGNAAAFIFALRQQLQQQQLRYVEVRPTVALDETAVGVHSTHTYWWHYIDLKPDIATLFNNCHKDSTQRKVRRAEREGLTYEEGHSTSLLDAFYLLLIRTRRRHLIPPQPRRWFQNLIDCFGTTLKLRVAFNGKQPVAAILTLRHKNILVYKYGCSDERLHNLGGMHFLFWKSIQEAKHDGLRIFDLGRSDPDNEGLITFKNRWGARCSALRYVKLLSSPQMPILPSANPWQKRIAKTIFPYLPDRIVRSAGELIYRHIG